MNYIFLENRNKKNNNNNNKYIRIEIRNSAYLSKNINTRERLQSVPNIYVSIFNESPTEILSSGQFSRSTEAPARKVFSPSIRILERGGG